MPEQRRGAAHRSSFIFPLGSICQFPQFILEQMCKPDCTYESLRHLYKCRFPDPTSESGVEARNFFFLKQDSQTGEPWTDQTLKHTAPGNNKPVSETQSVGMGSPVSDVEGNKPVATAGAELAQLQPRWLAPASSDSRPTCLPHGHCSFPVSLLSPLLGECFFLRGSFRVSARLPTYVLFLIIPVFIC